MSEEIRPSRVVKEDIKNLTSLINRLNSNIVRIPNLIIANEKYVASLKAQLENLKSIIEENGGTASQLLLLKTLSNKIDESKFKNEEYEKTLRESEQLLPEKQADLIKLNDELTNSLLYEERLRERQTQTLVDISNPINSSNPVPSTIVIPKNTTIEVLSTPSLDGAVVPAFRPGLGGISSVFVKIGNVSLDNKITSKSLDYNKVVIGNEFRKGDSPIPVFEGPSYSIYTKTSFNFDTTLVITSTFVLVDSELNHSDGSVWGLVSNRFAING